MKVCFFRIGLDYTILFSLVCFFFSSRRRHTRYIGDWSSDVCSSDLGFGNYLIPLQIGTRDMAFPRLNAFSYWVFVLAGIFMYSSYFVGKVPDGGWFKIGRASCRERVWM